MKIETKELSLVKTRLTKAENHVSGLVIKNQEDYEGALKVSAGLRSVEKELTEAKDKIVKPLNESLKEVRNLFRPFETKISELKSDVESKILSFRASEQKKKDADIAKVEADLKAGKITEEKAVAKVEKVEEKRDLGKAEKQVFKKIKTVVFEDISKIPDQYWIVDEVAVRKDALAGVEIAGVKVEEKEIIANAR